MIDLPGYIGLTFIGCVVATASFIYFSFDQASRKLNSSINWYTVGILGMLVIGVSLLGMNGVMLNFDSRPPRLMLLVAPVLLLIIGLFLFKKTRFTLMRLPISSLTYIHIIRIPVEIVLWWLFVHGKVPEAMTFEGVNFDILSGITAPFAAIFLVGHKIHYRFGAIIWNLIALGLLFNIVIRAVLATPYFYDPALFETPNVAVFYFPFILLPAFVVPAVLFSHLVSLMQLFSRKDDY